MQPLLPFILVCIDPNFPDPDHKTFYSNSLSLTFRLYLIFLIPLKIVPTHFFNL